jgi:hypothetical protein
MRRRTPRGQAAPRVARTLQRLMLAGAAPIPPDPRTGLSGRESGQCGDPICGAPHGCQRAGCRCRSAVLGYPVEPIGDAE